MPSKEKSFSNILTLFGKYSGKENMFGDHWDINAWKNKLVVSNPVLAGRYPNLRNHLLQWKPCGNPCVKAKNRGWHVNRPVGPDNRACDGKAKCTELLPASVPNQQHDGKTPLQPQTINPPKPRRALPCWSHGWEVERTYRTKEIHSFEPQSRRYETDSSGKHLRKNYHFWFFRIYDKYVVLISLIYSVSEQRRNGTASFRYAGFLPIDIITTERLPYTQEHTERWPHSAGEGKATPAGPSSAEVTIWETGHSNDTRAEKPPGTARQARDQPEQWVAVTPPSGGAMQATATGAPGRSQSHREDTVTRKQGGRKEEMAYFLPTPALKSSTCAPHWPNLAGGQKTRAWDMKSLHPGTVTLRAESGS